MPSFDPATAPSSSTYPPPTTVSSDSRSSHSVTPQSGAAHQQQPHGAPPPTSAYMGYHPGMGHSVYPPPGSAMGSSGDKQQSQPQQYSAWHAYPPFPAYHGGPPGFGYSADGSNSLMQQTQQQQGYPHASYPQQRLRSSPPPKRDSPDKPVEILSSNTTTSSPATSNHRSSTTSGGGEQKEPELAEVKPIKTDFHFFVKDVLPELRDAAVAEVDESLQGKSESYIATHRQYLVNSNLNCRVMKMWEDIEQERREDYFQKEETDRKRFMEEDNVASRHCFTLTARQRSPIEGEGTTSNGSKRPSSTNPGDEDSPHKKTNVVGTDTFFAPVVGDM